MEILAFCRAGFEKEVAAELSQHCSENSIHGYVKAKAGNAFVQFVSDNSEGMIALLESPIFRELVFIRHWCISLGEIAGLNPEDRVSPLLAAADELGTAINKELSGVQVVALDTNEGKSLGKLSKAISRRLEKSLSQASNGRDWTFQLTFCDGARAFLGAYPVNCVSQWLGGIPRLRVPREAPSRATLKLEEAWHHFIPRNQWQERIAGGMKAVDLGAAPGGWTWQLVNKSMFVDAVDNGPMAEVIMESGQVSHKMEDGFNYSPLKPVDWLVCDIADKPAKVASLIGRWAANRWCREAIFNLKLPMKQRYTAVQSARESICRALDESKMAYQLRFKQLYHDREEVTGHLMLY